MYKRKIDVSYPKFISAAHLVTMNPPEEKRVYAEGEKGPGGISIECAMNREGDVLPYGYFNPETEGKLTWVCGEGPTEKGRKADIISVYAMDLGDHTEKKISILESLDQAKFVRDELVRNGWKKLVAPTIAFTVSSENGSKAPLNRQQKRDLGRKIKKLSKK